MQQILDWDGTYFIGKRFNHPDVGLKIQSFQTWIINSVIKLEQDNTSKNAAIVKPMSALKEKVQTRDE
jgi:hypothetical protein